MVINSHSIIESLSYFLLICLLLLLSVWQINRGITQQNTLSLTENNTIYALDDIKAPFGQQKVMFQGCLKHDSVWLLENQFFKQQLGYDIIVTASVNTNKPPSLGRKTNLLINLGWVPLAAINQKSILQGQISQKAAIKKILYKHHIDLTPNHETCQPIKILGRTKPPYDLPFVSNIFSPATSVVEITPSSFPVQHLINDYYLEIDPNHPLALKTHWERSMLNGRRHFSYALQWFLMAIAVCVYFYISLKRRNIKINMTKLDPNALDQLSH